MIKTPLSTVIGGAFWTPGATVINGAKLSFEIVMKKLFANGEQGFWYDPNDMGTMFQDAAGTVPVTGVGQAVGLVLDKTKGLVIGSELISQPLDFSGWTKTAAVTSAAGGTFTTNGGGGCTLPIFGINNIKSHLIRIKGTTSVATTIRNGGALTGSFIIPAGSFDIVSHNPLISTVGASLYIALITTGIITIDNISIKELAGNHSHQTTSSMRPLLVASPQRLDYDTAEDKLITTLPAQLTGCTVIRSVPNVGTQILTGQTIPATYEDNKDHCGLIVINRALTPSETSAIAAEFNKRAGV